jgi:Flp pilus assembly pilin Flp
MNDMHLAIKTFVAEENGAEVTELGIVLALLVAGAVAAITLMGPKIAQYYTVLNSGLP